MTTRMRAANGALAALFLSSSLCLGLAQPSLAGPKSREKNWKLGTYVAGAGTAAALATGKGTLALLGAGATLLSYSQWKKEVKKRHQRADRASYASYRRAWARRHHRR